MQKLVALYMLRDEICAKTCSTIEQFVRGLFTERGRIYTRVFFCTVARANIVASESIVKKVKTPSSQNPDLFGPYLMPMMDIHHFIHERLYKNDKLVWARYFINYFRIFIEKEYAGRISPMITLNILSRIDFIRMCDKGIENLQYGKWKMKQNLFNIYYEMLCELRTRQYCNDC